MDPKGKGIVIDDKEKGPSTTMSQREKSQSTQAQTIRRTGKRRGASRR
jgi:hypothetical protein